MKKRAFLLLLILAFVISAFTFYGCEQERLPAPSDTTPSGTQDASGTGTDTGTGTGTDTSTGTGTDTSTSTDTNIVDPSNTGTDPSATTPSQSDSTSTSDVTPTSPVTPDINCNHQFTIKVVEVTCLSNGYTEYTCSLCSYTYMNGIVLSSGRHSYEENVVPATCMTDGYTEYKCSKCGDSYVGDEVKSNGQHVLEKSKTVKATCLKEGYTEYKCTAEGCDYKEQKDPKPKTTHNYTTKITEYASAKSDGKATKSCSNCSSTEVTAIKYSDMFKSALTNGTTIKARGIDISSYQSGLTEDDFKLIKSKYDYIILRAGSTNIGEQTGNVYTGEDDWFDTYYDLAKKVGLPVGTYYYVKDPKVNGSYTGEITLDHIKKEAQKFVKIIEGKTFEYPVYFDLEDPSFEQYGKDILTEYCLTFCDITQKAGFYSGVYLGKYWLSGKVNSDTLISNFDLWIPVYAGGDGTDWNEVFGNGSGYSVTVDGKSTNLHNTPVGMYQYTASEYISSSPLNTIDANVCYIDYPTITKNLRDKGYIK